MDTLRLKYIDSFPKINSNISNEIGIMVFNNKPYLNCLENTKNNLSLEDWYRWYYSYCQDESYHLNKIKQNIDLNETLLFIPISIYKFDPLHIILDNIKEYPNFGKELPYGHQTVLIKYNDKYYYYDPENVIPEYVHKLEELFGRIYIVGNKNIQSNTNDTYCLAHTLNFIKLVKKYPNELENMDILKRITTKNVDKQLYNIVKKLI